MQDLYYAWLVGTYSLVSIQFPVFFTTTAVCLLSFHCWSCTLLLPQACIPAPLLSPHQGVWPLLSPLHLPKCPLASHFTVTLHTIFLVLTTTSWCLTTTLPLHLPICLSTPPLTFLNTQLACPSPLLLTPILTYIITPLLSPLQLPFTPTPPATISSCPPIPNLGHSRTGTIFLAFIMTFWNSA